MDSITCRISLLIFHPVAPSAFRASYTLDNPLPSPASDSLSACRSLSACSFVPRVRITNARSERCPPSSLRVHDSIRSLIKTVPNFASTSGPHNAASSARAARAWRFTTTTPPPGRLHLACICFMRASKPLELDANRASLPSDPPGRCEGATNPSVVLST
eukprot:scaffold1022_cov307-Pavlova_lutheri.AAC.4